jgi:hypothetical protein
MPVSVGWRGRVRVRDHHDVELLFVLTFSASTPSSSSAAAEHGGDVIPPPPTPGVDHVSSECTSEWRGMIY